MCIVLVGKNIQLDAICHQFEPYPYRQMCLHAGVTALVPLCMTWDAVEAVPKQFWLRSWFKFAAALIPLLFGNSIPHHTTREPPACKGIWQ